VFVTAVYGVLHRPSGRFTYVRAGHDRPLLYRPGQPIRVLPGDGRFLGMLAGLELMEEVVKLQTGDRLLFTSDGVPDAVNPQGVPYDSDRLMSTLAKYGRLTAAELVQYIAADVAAWQKHAPPFDDITMLVLEVEA
jgi:sigma-B regulation protein RsbU (phosphoserine phosphatase)